MSNASHSHAVPLMRAGKIASASFLVAGLAACTTTGNETASVETSTATQFAASHKPAEPAAAKRKKATGVVGKPYKVAGRWYRPKRNPEYDKIGLASWYGPNFHGQRTASGEVYNQHGLSAAHKTLPLPCYVRVTNEMTGDAVTVRVNDRGPFADNRIIDLSNEAAKLLHMRSKGVAKVRVTYVGKASSKSDDTSLLMASYRSGSGDAAPTPSSSGAGTMVASNDSDLGWLPGVSSADASNRSLPVSAAAMVSTKIRTGPAQREIQDVLVPQHAPMPAARPSMAPARPEPARDPAVNAFAPAMGEGQAAGAFRSILANGQHGNVGPTVRNGSGDQD
ncbi:septal ring lytic transglycosylase RlpA family protein [Pararhizobium mangrovi]|uniref:septal ring lytic transglycosylase RlpA family protein n=1 Tax=Pararhizobium mangrovi TaxID=2590452 RepID=UPI0015E83C91|nr:septal ring lytic transglycosylase RlpA family protein [Pararhizobium mangrovi]